MKAHSLLRRTLIAFSIAAACAPAVSVSAATTIVLHRNLPAQLEVTAAKFDVDEGTGRVRLAFDVFDPTYEGNTYRTEYLDVPGLRVDRERREVLYENGGSVVTCAQRKKFLWETTYPATEACRFVLSSEPQLAGSGSGVSSGKDVSQTGK